MVLAVNASTCRIVTGILHKSCYNASVRLTFLSVAKKVERLNFGYTPGEKHKEKQREEQDERNREGFR